MIDELDLAPIHELGGEGEAEDAGHTRVALDLALVCGKLLVGVGLECLGLTCDLVGDSGKRRAIMFVLDGIGHRMIGGGFRHLALLDTQKNLLDVRAVCHAMLLPLSASSL